MLDLQRSHTRLRLWPCALALGALVGCGGSGISGDYTLLDSSSGGEDLILPDVDPELDAGPITGDVDGESLPDAPPPPDVADTEEGSDVEDASAPLDALDPDTIADADQEVTAADVSDASAAEDTEDVAPDVAEPPPECLVDGDCPALHPCQQAYCDDETLTCESEPLAEGASCDDGNACSEAETCQAGVCVGAVALSCDDDNVCTDDLCDPASGCVYGYNFGECDDGNDCMTDDLCIAGVCAGQKPACDDGNPCTLDQCVPGTAVCVNTADDLLPCSDGNACTGGDHCTSGSCVPGAADGCDDGNDCSLDVCDEGACKNLPLEDEPCDDGEVCTVDDTCQLAVCISGQLNDCDDGNPCTIDSCEVGVGCVQEPVVNQPCDDGDVCTQDEACDAASDCVPATTTDCDDDNPCTVDNCHPDNGCVYAVKGGLCDDGNPCTAGDHCVVGECKGQLATCTDNDVCTHDSCDETLGCQFVSTAAACIDDKVCTDDACDPEIGCTFTPNTLACDDGLLCTEDDTCSEGLCVGQGVDCADDDECTAETCDAEEGCVIVVTPGAPCEDGDPCTQTGDCDPDGLCVGGEAVSTDDGIACTLDACTLEEGVTHTPDDALCDAGRVCDAEAGCVLGDTPLLVTKIAWAEGVGVQWVALVNAGDVPFELRGLALQDGEVITPLIAASGDPEASVLLEAGGTAAALLAPEALPDAATDGYTLIIGAAGAAPTLIPTGGELLLVSESGELVDAVDFSSPVTEGAVEPTAFPVVVGWATEFDATATAVSTTSEANDPAGLWCTWPAGAGTPEGPQLPCSRARLNEVSLAGEDGDRWVELHMPAGGSLVGLFLRFANADGEQLAQVGPLSGRTPMSGLVLLQDGVDDLVLAQLTDGAVQLVRTGELLDAYGFGALTESLDGTFNLPLLEGTAGPAQAPGDAAGRAADGADTDDNAADWVTTAGGSPGLSNETP